MGVSRTDYVFLGIRVDCDDFTDDTYEQYEMFADNGYRCDITEYNGLTIIYDGMCGNYVFIGKIITKAIGSNGLPITKCSYVDTINDASEIRQKLNMYFPQYKDEEISIYAFTHWF